MTLANAVNATTAGLQSLSSTGVWNGRTLTGTANQVAVSNGDGISGNPTISLTSNIYVSGVSFDSGSNTLSNYSTGTFTPTITNTGSAPTVTYTTQFGSYMYIGNRVICNVNLTLNTYTAGTGDVQISSLPFTSNNTSNNITTGPYAQANVTFGLLALYYILSLSPNTTSVNPSAVLSASTNLNLAASGPTAGSSLRGNLNYEV